MRKHTEQRLAWFAGALLVVVFAAACAPTEPAEGALLEGGVAIYQDGTYVAAFSHTGTDGWQPYLQIQVRAGLITAVCYGAINASGALIADDENYRERTRLDSGVDIMGLVARLETLLITFQQLRFELPVSGLNSSLSWSLSFAALAEAALDLARTGSGSAVTIPTFGPYFGNDQPDEIGWEAHAVLGFGESGVSVASFEEYRLGTDGQFRLKASDPVYTEAYERVLQLTPAGVAEELSRQVVEQGISETGESLAIDGITGATGTSDRFQILATRVARLRVAVPLPNKLCP